MYPSCSNDKEIFKIDPHIHTAEVSPCGQLSAAEIVQRYHEQGYHGLLITDHMHEEYINGLPCKNEWQACVQHFLQGYQNAKAAGEPLGMKILLGVEVRFIDNDCDYLLIGVDEAFLYNNPYFHMRTLCEFYHMFGDQLLIIQAHPYRYNDHVQVEHIHGFEIHNTNPRHDSRNKLAQDLFREHPSKFTFAGSDTHRVGDECQTQMWLHEAVHDAKALRDVVLKQKYHL